MKKMMWLLLAAALLLPCLAMADTVQLTDFLMCSVGEKRLPIYPDYSGYIGEGLTKDDFDVTYASSSPYVTVEADGTVFISDRAKLNANYPLEITYTPKVEGVGETTVFQGRLRTTAAIPDMTAEKNFYRLRAGGSVSLVVELHGGSTSLVASVTADSDAVEVTKVNRDWGSDSIRLTLEAKRHGTAVVTVQTYSGLTETIELDVIGPPTQFKFAQEHFTAHPGETIDLGLDMGNGPYGLEYYYSFGKQVYRDGQWVNDGALDSLRGTFRAGQSGEYRVVCTWEGSVQGEFRVTVVDRANCEDIAFSTGGLYLNREAQIMLLDEYGEEIYRPFTITKGAELVKLNYRTIMANAPGTVEITVQNEDGSTVIRNFEVQAIPTQMTLNASELTLEIGQVFDLEVTFDQGSDAYTCTVLNETAMSHGMSAVRMEGDRIIAQAPGKAVINVRARDLEASCTVAVPDSDLAVHMVYPEKLGVNQSFQLSVEDKTGKAYPAVWRKSDGNRLNITAGGLVTGMYEGTQTVIAELADGRILQQRLSIVKLPSSLEHPDLTVHENWTTVSLETIRTDVGDLSCTDVTVEVEDESVATFEGLSFKFHKAGTTKVTLTAKEGGAQGSFTLTVLKADATLYIHVDDKVFANSHIVDVPTGYYILLPQLYDYYGNRVAVTWRMVEDIPAGSPTGVGFYFDGEVLACSWGAAVCIVEATSQDGGTFQLQAHGYHMAQEIRFQQESYTLQIGEQKPFSVEGVDHVYTGPVYWTLTHEGIVTLEQHSSAYAQGVMTALRPGTTTLTATLINGATASCTITVEGVSPVRIPGDANDDGDVNIMDALAVLQKDVGWDVEINPANADVNADGAANIMDALLILQKDVGWDVELR